jgi:hypothetical protein
VLQVFIPRVFEFLYHSWRQELLPVTAVLEVAVTPRSEARGYGFQDVVIISCVNPCGKTIGQAVAVELAVVPTSGVESMVTGRAFSKLRLSLMTVPGALLDLGAVLNAATVRVDIAAVRAEDVLGDVRVLSAGPLPPSSRLRPDVQIESTRLSPISES